MKRLLGLIAALLLIAGCFAANYMVAREKQPGFSTKRDKAVLVIVRDTFYGGSIFNHYVDSKFIGNSFARSFFITQVSPGTHYIITTAENTSVIKMDLRAGRIYALRQGVTHGFRNYRSTGFSPLTQKELNEAIKVCTYYELDPKATPPDLDAAFYKGTVDQYNAELKADPAAFKAVLAYKGFR
jgi:hypothetical protein